MKVVIEIATGKPVYRSDPPFKKGFGIKNAVALFGGVAVDYKEVTLTETEYNALPFIVAQREAAENKAKIAAKIRQTAIDALIELGELPEAYCDDLSLEA